jgi:hypothetical protein
VRRKGYKPYGKYVKTISELKKDDSSVFYVGRINPRYLGGAIDVRRHSRYVILTGYRYNHYMARHREMKDYGDLMPSVLEHPDVVGKSRFPRALRFIFSQQYDKRYLSLIVEIKRKKREHEVISFFFEGERDIRARRRRALVIWEREMKETTRPDRHPGIS